jgi:acyl-CoA thioesterase I
MKRAALLVAMALFADAATAAEPIRIVAFGTSLTARQDWQDELAVQLDDCAPVEVTTIARGGANSDWAVENLPRVAAARPAIVLIEFAVNDASLLHGVSLEQSRANTEAILAALAASGAQPMLMTMNPAHGVRLLSRPWLADYYRLYREIAAERGAILIDLTPVWDARGDFSNAIPDGVHPSAEAAREVIVPHVGAVLKPLLCP